MLSVLAADTINLEGDICSELSGVNETDEFAWRILVESFVDFSLLYNLEESALIM